MIKPEPCSRVIKSLYRVADFICTLSAEGILRLRLGNEGYCKTLVDQIKKFLEENHEKNE
jgi:hypothetical protein